MVTQWAAYLVSPLGGALRIGRRILIPAVLTLGVAGSVLPATAIAPVAAPAHSAHAPAIASGATPQVFYRI